MSIAAYIAFGVILFLATGGFVLLCHALKEE